MIPTTTKELIEFLQERYPPRCIQKDQSLEEAHRYAGKVELIEFLQEKQRQSERSELLEPIIRKK